MANNEGLKKNLNKSLAKTGRVGLVTKDNPKRRIQRQCELLEIAPGSYLL